MPRMNIATGDYNLSEIADEADLALVDIQNGKLAYDGDMEMLKLALEFVIHQAEKRERRRDRNKNVQAKESS